MKLKMSRNSLFAVLLRSPWWVSLLVVALVALVSMALLPKDYAPFGIMGGFPFMVTAVMAAKRQWNAPSPDRITQVLQLVRTLTWPEFSSLLERSLTQQGYTVTRLNIPSADLSLHKAGQTTLVSCKRWKAANHGVEALRNLVAAKNAQGVDFCTYICLEAASNTAQRYARDQGVALISGAAIATLLADATLSFRSGQAR